MPSIKINIVRLSMINLAVIGSCAALVLAPPLAIDAQAQSDPAIAIDRAFRYDSSSRQGALIGNLKRWMGAYQRIVTEDNNYLVIFDSGSIPVVARFSTSGALETIIFGCPRSKSLSINDAPEGIRQELSKCAGFRS